VLRAAQLLADDPDIVFLLVGHGAQKKMLQAQAAEMKLNNVVFHKSVSKEQMPELWSTCDVALVHLKNDPVFSTVIPSKIFEAFGMGKPIMIVQPDGEAANLIREAGAGEWVPPEQPQALARAVREWHADRERVAAYAKKSHVAAAQHSRDRLAARMAEILHRVAGS